MKHFPRLAVAWTFGLFFIAASTGDSSVTTPAGEDLPQLQEARRISVELTEKVRGLLMSELSKGGFEGAVKVCSEVAPGIAEGISKKDVMEVRRVSLKYRNPKDAPDRYETSMLRQFEKDLAEGKLAPESAYVVKTEGRETLRYLKPIVVGKMCLTCHGSAEEIPPSVASLLKQKYPKDLATGYKEGDLRGAVSVTMPLARLPSK